MQRPAGPECAVAGCRHGPEAGCSKTGGERDENGADDEHAEKLQKHDGDERREIDTAQVAQKFAQKAPDRPKQGLGDLPQEAPDLVVSRILNEISRLMTTWAIRIQIYIWNAVPTSQMRAFMTIGSFNRLRVV